MELMGQRGKIWGAYCGYYENKLTERCQQINPEKEPVDHPAPGARGKNLVKMTKKLMFIS